MLIFIKLSYLNSSIKEFALFKIRFISFTCLLSFLLNCFEEFIIFDLERVRGESWTLNIHLVLYSTLGLLLIFLLVVLKIFILFSFPKIYSNDNIRDVWQLWECSSTNLPPYLPPWGVGEVCAKKFCMYLPPSPHSPT